MANEFESGPGYRGEMKGGKEKEKDVLTKI